MSDRLDRVLRVIDSGLQSSSETGYFTDHAEMCARCQRVEPEDGDLCTDCRAFLLGDGPEPMPSMAREWTVGPPMTRDQFLAQMPPDMRALVDGTPPGVTGPERVGPGWPCVGGPLANQVVDYSRAPGPSWSRSTKPSTTDGTSLPSGRRRSGWVSTSSRSITLTCIPGTSGVGSRPVPTPSPSVHT